MIALCRDHAHPVPIPYSASKAGSDHLCAGAPMGCGGGFVLEQLRLWQFPKAHPAGHRGRSIEAVARCREGENVQTGSMSKTMRGLWAVLTRDDR